MKARTLFRTQRVEIVDDDHIKLHDQPIGSIVEGPDSWQLVRFGCAEPADEECEAAAGMTREEIVKAARGYAEVDAGIHPDDRALFRTGKIIGYKPDFDPANELPSEQYLKGPNWTAEDAEAIDGIEYEEETDDAVEP